MGAHFKDIGQNSSVLTQIELRCDPGDRFQTPDIPPGIIRFGLQITRQAIDSQDDHLCFGQSKLLNEQIDLLMGKLRQPGVELTGGCLLRVILGY